MSLILVYKMHKSRQRNDSNQKKYRKKQYPTHLYDVWNARISARIGKERSENQQIYKIDKPKECV